MKSLFDEQEMYTREADVLWREFRDLLKPLIEAYRELGYNSRDIESIAREAVYDIALDVRLG